MTLVACPFCEEPDFDLIGLKHHLLSGYCEAFEKVEACQPTKRVLDMLATELFEQGQSVIEGKS